MKYIIILLLALLPITSHAQNEKQLLGDSIESLEKQIIDLKRNLGYDEDKYADSIIEEGEVFYCKVIDAYYDDLYLNVKIQFFSNSEGTLQFSQIYGTDRNVFCILNERLLRVHSFDSLGQEKSVSLTSGVPENVTMKFNIYECHFDKRPRLIEFIKLKEKQTGKEFIFRNIAIDMDKED